VKLQIVARHAEISESMKDYADEKVQKLLKYFDSIQKAEVILNKERDHFTAEIVIALRKGKPHIAREKAGGGIEAIDLAIGKLEKQLRRLKDELRNHKGGQKISDPALAVFRMPEEKEVVEESYEDVDKLE
jgi:putative sigma-54 modulation protein